MDHFLTANKGVFNVAGHVLFEAREGKGRARMYFVMPNVLSTAPEGGYGYPHVAIAAYA